MKTMLQLLTISVAIPFIAGCMTISPLHNIDDQSIGHELSEQQVKEAINSGLEAAGWTAEKEGPGHILATYTVRTHTVAVNIRYTAKNYSIHYAYSINMKVNCTAKDRPKGIILTKWPEKVCGGSQPEFIHAGYNKWVKRLDLEIDAALSSS